MLMYWYSSAITYTIQRGCASSKHSISRDLKC